MANESIIFTALNSEASNGILKSLSLFASKVIDYVVNAVGVLVGKVGLELAQTQVFALTLITYIVISLLAIWLLKKVGKPLLTVALVILLIYFFIGFWV